jgi:hypothetical protein
MLKRSSQAIDFRQQQMLEHVKKLVLLAMLSYHNHQLSLSVD